MSMRQIAPAEWPSFLDRFSRDHRAWLATVQRGCRGTPPHVESAERPLASVTAIPEAAGCAGILIRFGDGTDAADVVKVDAPAALRVEEERNGAARGLEIENDAGECTRLSFRIAAPPGLLDGVAPGEL